MSPSEHEKLWRCMEELLSKRHICESLSSCAVPSHFTLKKDESWHMCMDSQAINKIMV